MGIEICVVVWREEGGGRRVDRVDPEKKSSSTRNVTRNSRNSAKRAEDTRTYHIIHEEKTAKNVAISQLHPATGMPWNAVCDECGMPAMV